jgi:nicotinate phosphoribosyltransferase
LITPSALLTDLYQLTMLQAYFDQQMEQTAVFELFVRKLPACRNFLVAAGLEQALDYLENLHFTAPELDWLANTGRFSREFIAYLEEFRFCGDVHAMAEGTVFFANEPILRVTAPLPQAQLVETCLINLLHLQTLIASKAARMVLAAPGKLLIDFGLRRAHGTEAGLLAARAGYLAGLSGSSNVLAGMLYDLPIYGTMAHSFIQAHDDEMEAFAHFAASQPNNLVCLLDTYDTEAAAQQLVTLAPKLEGVTIQGVRLDSGDLAEHARKVRRILDDGGLRHVRILASSNLDEYALQKFVVEGAPIDGFGIGSRLDTSADAPYLDCVYKLQQYAGKPRLKRSEGKATWPGSKQVYRNYAPDGSLAYDLLTLEDAPSALGESLGEPLLQPVMRGGQRLFPTLPLAELRQYAALERTRLPETWRSSEEASAYPVKIAQVLADLAMSIHAKLSESPRLE